MTHENRVQQLAYVGLHVRDLSAWKDFAEKSLGFVTRFRSDEVLEVFTDALYPRAILHQGSEEGLAYLGWEAQNHQTLQGISQRVPHEILIAESQLQSERGIPTKQTVRFTDPNGIENHIFVGAMRPISTSAHVSIAYRFKADALGFGHVTLNVPDPRQTMNFYSEIIGARVSDYITRMKDGQPREVAFLRVNRRHHSLAVGNTPNKEQGVSLGHLMIEMKSLRDIGLLRDRCLNDGFKVTSIGQHTNDETTSFYTSTPSNFSIEFGFGGMEVDDRNWSVRQFNSTSIWGHQ